MYYNITFNVNNIRKISKSTKLYYEQIGKLLGIDKQHFSEKDNWYKVDNMLQYFKTRNDSRIFGELLSDEILRMHGFETAQYSVASLGDNIGLLSPNIQKEGYKYESVATLGRLIPGFSNSYYTDSKKVTLEKILYLLEQDVPNFEELRKQIIRKYVIDWFTNQLDYNIRNMTFEIAPDGTIRIPKIIDSESSFGATKQGLNSEINDIWIPAIPAHDATFRTGPYKEYGCDANIIYLLFEYPEIVLEILNELINSNYNGLLEKYKEKNSSNSEITLNDRAIDSLDRFINDRQEEANELYKFR